MNTLVNQNHLISRVLFVRLFAITLAYYLTGKLGLSVPFFGSHVTLFWLPSGIAVAAMLRFGWGCWPAVYLGAFLVNLAVGSSIQLALEIAIGNTLAPVFTSWLLRRMRVDLALSRHQDIPLLCLSAALGMLVSALNGVMMLWFANVITTQTIISVLTSWWMGDFVGVLLTTPLLLAISHSALKELWLKRSELIAWSVVAVVVIWLAFFAKFAGAANLPLVFLPLPLTVWAALRFGLLGAATSTLLLSFLAVLGTSFGGGPFHGVSQHVGLLLLWVYMVTLLITNLIVTALLAERNYAEILLKSSLAQTKLLLDASLDAVVNMNQNGIVTEWNFQAEKIFGYSQQQAIGRELAALIVPPALRESHRHGLTRFIKTKTPKLFGKRIEVTGMRADGTEFPIELTLAMLENQGQFNFSAYMRDITERKQAEDNLRIAATAFQSQEGVIITDANQLILRVNRAFTSITGYSLQDVKGKNPRILSSGKQNASFYADMWQKINTTDAWEGEIWNRRKNGEVYPEYITVTAVRDHNNVITNYVGSLTDITLRKIAEEKIQSLAFYDPLTQLPNRRLFLDRLKP